MNDAVPRSADAALDGAPLDGTHVLLTGATGFVGQALLEKLLSSYPRTQVSVLIRARGADSAQDRLTTLLDKPVFTTWRAQVGDEYAEKEIARRVRVVEGDLDETLQLPAGIDAVIHVASDVKFDPPIDAAFDSNVSGARALYEALVRSGADPHVVHVSTAYVSGVQRGVVPEAPLRHTVDWRIEAAAAAQARTEAEQDSRRPDVLRPIVDRARAQHGKAGALAVAQAAEEARVAWVHSRLVDAGRVRAQSLGWPDVYTFTKALGERVAECLWAAAGHRLSVLRPSIIESALRYPYPGWIDGFKVADPLIVAYGQGYLREFPGLADSILDVIPVDMVANAALAAAAARPPRGTPTYLHATSSARNPLSFQTMYEHVHSYFLAHPMSEPGERAVDLPTWHFQGSSQVLRHLRRQRLMVGLAEQALVHLPAFDRTRAWLASTHKRRAGLDRLRDFTDLYQSYTESEVVYDDTHTRALHDQVDAQRRDVHGFDPNEVNWEHYLQKVHVPSITEEVRAIQQRKKAARVTAAMTTGFATRTDVAAVFDLQGTVLDTNAVEHYLWTQLARLPRTKWPREMADLARSLPSYICAERRDRGEFIRRFVQRFKGMEQGQVEQLVDELLAPHLTRRLMPDAVRRIEAHRAAGHRTVLVTGTIEAFVRPLAPLFDRVEAARMHTEDGRWTGLLDAPPLVEEARAAWLTRYAESAHIDLAASYAYGDSQSDRVWLDLVGHPQAVNPDVALFQHAKSERWPIHSWDRPRGRRLDAFRAGLSTKPSTKAVP